MPPERSPRKARSWTAEEEAIFNEIAADCLRKHLAAMVRADGRLEGRTGSSINSHVTAFINQKGIRK